MVGRVVGERFDVYQTLPSPLVGEGWDEGEK